MFQKFYDIHYHLFDLSHPYLDKRQKELISEINPERFLFG